MLQIYLEHDFFGNNSAKWILNNDFREYMLPCMVVSKICMQILQIQKYAEGRTRYVTLSLFELQLQNDENGSVFCAPCMLFAEEGETNACSFTKEGFDIGKMLNIALLNMKLL